jgi:hypothetical protein
MDHQPIGRWRIALRAATVRGLSAGLNVEWAVQRSMYMTFETIAPMSDDPLISLPAVAG